MSRNSALKQKAFFTSDHRHASPLVRASHIWKIVSDQLECLLGSTIHTQWFMPIIPSVIGDHVLILRTPNETSTRWINAHYRDLIENLVKLHDSRLTVFFMSANDF